MIVNARPTMTPLITGSEMKPARKPRRSRPASSAAIPVVIASAAVMATNRLSPTSGLGDTDGLTLVVGVASLAVVLGLRRVAPVVPGSLVAVLAGIAAVAAFGL